MRQIILATVAPVLLALSAIADEPTEKELKRFQGDWQMVAVTQNGETVKGDALKGQVWRFDGNKVIPLNDKDDVATITLDPTKKPATLDIKDKAGEVVEGIYKFTGDDKVTICGRSDSKRPKEFAAAKGSGAFMFELERVKKK